MLVELLSITPNAEKLIERAGRICYPEPLSKITENSSTKLIKHLIHMGHESVLEHGVATFHIDGISRSCSHQLVRHRIASYSQRSQRYCPEDDFPIIIPKSIDTPEKAVQYQSAMININESYKNLRKLGVKPEDARMVLPNACCTCLVMTMNFRSLRNFLNLRLDKHAQWEIRELANRMCLLLMEHAPVVFEDLYNKFMVAAK